MAMLGIWNGFEFRCKVRKYVDTSRETRQGRESKVSGMNSNVDHVIAIMEMILLLANAKTENEFYE